MEVTTGERLEDGWNADTPVEDSLLRRFLRNQGDMLEAFAGAAGGRAAEAAGVVLADAGTDLVYQNQAVLLRPVHRLDDEALDVIDDFWAGEDRGRTLLSVLPTPDLAPRGWHLMGHPMLVARPAGLHRHTPRPGVEARIVETAEDLGLFEDLTLHGYPMPELAGRPPLSVMPEGLLHSAIRYRIGSVDGTPVSTAASFVGRGVVNLCLAATLGAARRRGVWSNLVWARVGDAPDLPAVAFTSDDSRPGFVRMGFLPITRCTLWVR